MMYFTESKARNTQYAILFYNVVMTSYKSCLYFYRTAQPLLWPLRRHKYNCTPPPGNLYPIQPIIVNRNAGHLYPDDIDSGRVHLAVT